VASWSYNYGVVGGVIGALDKGLIGDAVDGAVGCTSVFGFTASIFFFHCEKYF
jgi:hypothetical protein